MDKEKVLKLATLARIEVSDEEAEDLVREFDSILKYVSEIKTSPQPLSLPRRGGDSRAASGGEVNVMREDTNPHESGIYTEDLLNAAPQREGDYVRVKKIL